MPVGSIRIRAPAGWGLAHRSPSCSVRPWALSERQQADIYSAFDLLA